MTSNISTLNGSLEYLKNSNKRIAFTTSFGDEGQMLGHLLVSHNINCDFITIDTGRNFPEYYEIWNKTEKKLKIKIKALYPKATDISALINKQGPLGFYDSIENRKNCCDVRKVFPLKKEIANYDIWITSVRKEQNNHRQTLKFVELNEKFNVIKVNPLLNIKSEELYSYIEKHKIPLNTLHKKGYKSVGCQPCTRPVLDDEHPRAGRWWWESSKKECGLHIDK